MWLVVGGAYQGKLNYVQGLYTDKQIHNGKTDSYEDLHKYSIWNQFHHTIEQMIENQQDPILFITENLEMLADKIIIIDEMGSGIVPMSKENRILREQVGRVSCLLAKYADRVERIMCGIAMTIKGEKE